MSSRLKRVTATVAILAFSAGSGALAVPVAAQDPSPAASTAPASDVTLNFWTAKKDGTDSIDAALADFTAATGIQVKHTLYANDGVSQSVQKAIGTDVFPDVFQFWTGIGQSYPFLEANQVEPLDAYYQKYGWDDTLVPAGIKLATFDGKKMAAPINVHGMPISYRKDLFTKAGITAEPTTFDELVADMDKLVAAGIAPFSFAGKQDWDSQRLVDNLFEHFCGAELNDQLRNMDADWSTTPCVTESLQTLADWSTKYLPKDWQALDPNSNQQYAPIFKGDAAMTVDGDWSVGTLTSGGQDLANWGVFDFPTDTDRGYGFTESLLLSSTSQHKDEGAQLIDYLLSKDVQQKYFGQLRSLVPPTLGVTIDPNLDDVSKGYIAAILGSPAQFMPGDQAMVPDIVTSYQRNYDKVIFGQETPQEAAAAIQADIATYKTK